MEEENKKIRNTKRKTDNTADFFTGKEEVDLKTEENQNTDKNNKQLASVNIELEKNIEKMKRKYKSSTFVKKINIIKSSYIFTYKSLRTKKIFFFWISIILGFLFLFLTLNALNNKFLITIPAYGGSFNEGIIGVPRYINPVLATSNPDKDLTKLVFSGLLKKTSTGELANDIAEEIERSEDGLAYTIKINPEAEFQDGVKLKADDVIFTVSKIQEKTIHSPIAIYFEGVTIEKIDDLTVIFHLKKPYLYFEENLTFGILPKHLLENLSNEEFLLAEFNTNPIGSGPFEIETIKKEANVAVEYNLISNREYIKGRPFIENLNITIYQNNEDLLEALNSGIIESTSYLDQSFFGNIENKDRIILESKLPNLFMLSFNPNKNTALSSKAARLFLEQSLDKDTIINSVFKGYATRRDNFFGEGSSLYIPEEDDIEALEEGTEISITTADIDDLKKVAEEVATSWRSKGVKVNIIVYNLNEITDVIKNRNFEVLLFGSIVQRDTDLFAYWDSSQRVYPGLNITNYASKVLDDNLEILKRSLDKAEREKALIDITEELSKEMPAIPLYSNNFHYIINDKKLAEVIQGNINEHLINNSERFLEINDWYKLEEKVWSFTNKRNLIEKLTDILH